MEAHSRVWRLRSHVNNLQCVKGKLDRNTTTRLGTELGGQARRRVKRAGVSPTDSALDAERVGAARGLGRASPWRRRPA